VQQKIIKASQTSKFGKQVRNEGIQYLQFTRPDKQDLISYVRGQSKIVELYDMKKEELKWSYNFSNILNEKAKIAGLITYGKGANIKHLVVDEMGNVVL